MYKVNNPKNFDKVPELGMGFHFGITTDFGPPESLIVINGSIGLTTTDVAIEILGVTFKTIIERKIREMPQAGRSLSEEEFRPSEEEVLFGTTERVIVPSENTQLFIESFGRWISRTERFSRRERLHESPPFPISSAQPQHFVRFSAFPNDRRVRPDASLLPGTYVTSRLDARYAPSGCAAVGRYALPNPLPAVHRFDIAAPAGCPGLFGTVAPAFGQAGGGAEIELASGAPSGSVSGPTIIPIY